jgi:hypothetical protein
MLAIRQELERDRSHVWDAASRMELGRWGRELLGRLQSWSRRKGHCSPRGCCLGPLISNGRYMGVHAIHYHNAHFHYRLHFHSRAMAWWEKQAPGHERRKKEPKLPSHDFDVEPSQAQRHALHPTESVPILQPG